jgi:hypothetical protein
VYRLLGMVVWRGVRWWLRRRYGRAMLPKPVLALIVLAGIGVAGAVGAAARSRSAPS